MVKPKLKVISEKYHYKDNFILNNSLGDGKLCQIFDSIRETCPPIMVKLDGVIWIHYSPIYFLEDNNSTVTLQKGFRGVFWSIDE